MKGYIVGLIGMWILSDAIYSLLLYLTAEGHNGKKQTWGRDHWIRIMRGVLGINLIIIGATLQ